MHVQAGQAKGSLSRSSRRSNYYIRSAGEVLELKPLYSCCLGARGAQIITLVMPVSAWQDVLFEKLREAPRGSEKLREAPRSTEKFREAPTGSEKLQEAPRSSREVAWGQFDLCQMDNLVCRLEASER